MPGNRLKREAKASLEPGRPEKMTKMLLDDDESSDKEKSSTSTISTSQISRPDPAAEFKINENFATRFEHNKQRAELHRLQEKYGDSYSNTNTRGRATQHQNQIEDTESSTDSEDEDDEGALVSANLDKQIQNTLEAIRRKDPRVYDEKATFYGEPEDDDLQGPEHGIKADKPLYLSDYHRKNLLDGDAPNDDLPNGTSVPYTKQQANLKSEIVKELHAAFNNQNAVKERDSDEEELLVRKQSSVRDVANDSKLPQKVEELNTKSADLDAEAYLSTYMSARAWVPSAGSGYQAFESDDEDEDRRADIFEEAYNLRFEDPNVANEKLLSHARDAAARYSVRKEVVNPRKKAREVERLKKAAAKQAREEEKARLRKLKVTELEAKISRIKDAAGIRGQKIQDTVWSTFFEEGWDDARWEQEMKKQFDDDYYADHDPTDVAVDGSKRSKSFKKPKWQDDIDIEDLVPGFTAIESNDENASSLIDISVVAGAAQLQQSSELDPNESASEEDRPKKQHKAREQRAGRTERRKVEFIVDEQMNVDETLTSLGRKHSGLFRYRETSPLTYGLTSNDILMADDSQLNQYAGLKKIAAYRDADKKRKDKKRLGKKARLRQWRKDTFGNEQGHTQTLADMIAERNGVQDAPYVKHKRKVTKRDKKEEGIRKR